MYAFQTGSQPASQSPKENFAPRVTPNILPCRINHDGPIDSSERFWAPVTDEEAKKTAYFRGRKLRGRRVAVPDGYQGMNPRREPPRNTQFPSLTWSTLYFSGIVAIPTDRVLPTSQQTDKNALDDDEVVEVLPEEPVNILETQGTFDGMVVWGHEVLPASDDTFVKGVEEWIRFAETMHGTPLPAANSNKK
ncbi:Ribonuclease H2 subunit C [Penicillium macrosclerotiorum]|uniref:Ribonuclease H2 subunit C n=1 Tax=Penicillium macrosclerotiorum TaxID=303699 RepID=UPI002547E6D1|nr:Ribonuclease H2 subunit C [Penicillium macrosclerotiorum]KAJ5674249.1 Ribonuclease H2 subunit C [Penicillium macrosclerotiorum]